MASLDGTLNVAGTSLEFVAVMVGGLALPYAARLRERIRGPLSVTFIGLGLAVGFVVIVIVPIVALLAITNVIDVIEPIPDTYGFILLGITWVTFPALAIGRWLSRASEDRLRRVLELMGLAFGVGVLLQLIAAATP